MILQTTKIFSGTVDVKREKHTDQIYFVICNSCYWCVKYRCTYRCHLFSENRSDRVENILHLVNGEITGRSVGCKLIICPFHHIVQKHAFRIR